MAALLPHLALLGSISFWSLAYISTKYALMAYDPVFLVFGRLMIATLVFLPVIRHFFQFRPTRSEWGLLVIMALCEPCASFILETLAMNRTSAAQAGMVAAMLPIMIAVAAMFVLKERLSLRAWLGLFVALIGVLWLSTGGEVTEHAPEPLLGNLLELGSMAVAVVNVILVKRLILRFSPLFLVAFQTAFGAFFYLPVLFLPQTPLPQAFPLLPTLGLVYLGTFVTIGAYVLYDYAMIRLPASQASIYVNLVPVLTLIFARVFLDESFTAQQYAASALVLAGVFLARSRARKINEQKTP